MNVRDLLVYSPVVLIPALSHFLLRSPAEAALRQPRKLQRVLPA